MKKKFYYVSKIFHHRSGEVIGKTVGIVCADSLEEAKEKIQQEYISDSSVLEFVEEINPDTDFSYTVYKSGLV